MRVFLSIGSNLSNRKKNMENALIEISKIVKILEVSSLYETEPIGEKEQPDFLNAVLEIDTELEPYQLINLLKGIESSLGRKKKEKWDPREIDIDILFYGNEIIETKNLKIPHPEIEKRKFVLVPLSEINSNFIHPKRNKTVEELLMKLNGGEKVEKIAYFNKDKMIWE
jgi:2-amino-4-hydroxy-6-hydroxymethyldihydropteridine diphosphokinase